MISICLLKKKDTTALRYNVLITGFISAHKIRGDQRSMIGKNQVMIADMSLMPITLIGHISPKKTTWEQFKYFQRSLSINLLHFSLVQPLRNNSNWRFFSPHGSCLMKRLPENMNITAYVYHLHICLFTTITATEIACIRFIFGPPMIMGAFTFTSDRWCSFTAKSDVKSKKPWGRGWFRIREPGDGSANEHCLSYNISA